MGILSKLNPFKKKEFKFREEIEKFEAPKLSTHTEENENLKAKIDLILTQMDSLKIQYSTLNEKIDQVEKMVKELLEMARSA